MPAVVIHQTFLWSESGGASGVSAFEIQSTVLSPEEGVTFSPHCTSGREVSASALPCAKSGPERRSHLYESWACAMRLWILFPGLSRTEKEEKYSSRGTVYKVLFSCVTVHRRKRTITVCSDFYRGGSHCINHCEKRVDSSSYNSPLSIDKSGHGSGILRSDLNLQPCLQAQRQIYTLMRMGMSYRECAPWVLGCLLPL